ncbi:putative oxidoreductase-like protein [Golovinomyces cichoracearum]|uniref:Putative oxidoreductase-like protein n=1 Tax=Golovinomyces cichoracearum TaxID=62708 RepID=A0A420J7P9_9PEZI|nr:putative oxidoreductase-like protein [Golovinomyces cichoracearum]
MPVYKGISLKIISQVDYKIHPEFPHPESTQFTYRSPESRKVFEDDSSPYISNDSKADSLLGRPSMVSVFIPSLRGSHFWLRYNFGELSVNQSSIFHFKLLLNGKCVKSWSVNSKEKPEGQIKQSFYSSGRKWNRVQERISLESIGKENKPFLCDEKKSSHPTRFNGLIEVVLFKSPGRKRRLHLLPEFKALDYENISSNQELLASTQRKESSFAMFKFHCRDWDFINNLQVMPINNHLPTRPTSPIGRKLLQSHHFSRAKNEKDTRCKEENSINSGVTCSARIGLHDSSKCAKNILPNLRKSPSSSNLRGANRNSPTPNSPEYSLRMKEFDSVTDLESNSESNESQCTYPHDNCTSQITFHRNSSVELVPRHSRSNSSISNTFSITSSLISYIDKNNSPLETVEIGTAAVQLISDRASHSHQLSYTLQT